MLRMSWIISYLEQSKSLWKRAILSQRWSLIFMVMQMWRNLPFPSLFNNVSCLIFQLKFPSMLDWRKRCSLSSRERSLQLCSQSVNQTMPFYTSSSLSQKQTLSKEVSKLSAESSNIPLLLSTPSLQTSSHSWEVKPIQKLLSSSWLQLCASPTFLPPKPIPRQTLISPNLQLIRQNLDFQSSQTS